MAKKEKSSAKIAHVENVVATSDIKATKLISVEKTTFLASRLNGRKHSEIIDTIVSNISRIEKTTTEQLTEKFADMQTNWYNVDGVNVLILAVNNVIENSGIKRKLRLYITDETAKKVVYSDSITSLKERLKTIVKKNQK